ncbi:MAG: hypothetical protein R3F61_04330 [Myxococcota bacterium]
MLLLLATALATAHTECRLSSANRRSSEAFPASSEVRFACIHSSSAPGGPVSRTYEWLEDGLVLVSDTGAEVELAPVTRLLRKPRYRVPALEPGRWTVWWLRTDASGKPVRATHDSASFWVDAPPQ